MSGCKMCDANRKDWKYEIVPYDFGELGKYELTMSVSGNGIWIELGPEKAEPLLSVHFKGIKYCPYCGRELRK